MVKNVEKRRYSKLHIDRTILETSCLASLFTHGAVQTGSYLRSAGWHVSLLFPCLYHRSWTALAQKPSLSPASFSSTHHSIFIQSKPSQFIAYFLPGEEFCAKLLGPPARRESLSRSRKRHSPGREHFVLPSTCYCFLYLLYTANTLLPHIEYDIFSLLPHSASWLPHKSEMFQIHLLESLCKATGSHQWLIYAVQTGIATQWLSPSYKRR